MKKYKICKAILVILAVFLCVVFYELLGICIAYKKQPEVSDTTRKETKNESWNERSENTERAVIIEKNPEALLQRVRLIQNAKEDIILSTFAFQSDESGKLILGALLDAAPPAQNSPCGSSHQPQRRRNPAVPSPPSFSAGSTCRIHFLR